MWLIENAAISPTVETAPRRAKVMSTLEANPFVPVGANLSTNVVDGAFAQANPAPSATVARISIPN